MQKAGVLHCCRTNDDVGQAIIKATFDGIQIADAATQLHRNLVADFLEDGLDRGFILRLAGKGAIEIHEMQTPRALGDPVPGHRRRILGKNRGVFHGALLQADAVTILEINRGYQQHRESSG